MTPDLRRALAAVAERLPAGSVVPVVREDLLALLAETPAAEPGVPPADLTVTELAARYGRKRSTVRRWIERGDFPGAYRLFEREWRVTLRAVTAFDAGQRGGRGGNSPLAGHANSSEP